ncbi:response regulator [Rhodobacter sp. KR11]|uniref:hybrid sensor histidine kinase/response regulator n=1 Tax=Rhodobacter sp. KR11 TaxID=2974588 RepID=UPI002222F3A9|nr:response regulator [Rhodobacter sp. KR11]MCW1920551.1 response regulator [Rhodobacter sp. KR11]
MILGAVVLARLDRQLTLQSQAQSDNLVWNLTQVEVDLQRLQIALLVARLSGANQAALGRVAQNFDILFSRVQTIRHGTAVADLPIRQTEGWRRLAGPHGLMDQLQEVLDHDPAQLGAKLDRFSQLAGQVQPLIHHAVTGSLQSAAETADAAKSELRATLMVFAGALLLTIGALALFLLTIHLQGRALAARARKLEHALRSQRLMIEAAQDGVLVIADNGRVIVANKVTEALLGPPLQPKRRRHLSDHLDPEVSALTACTQRQTIIRRADGARIPVELTMRSMRSPDSRSFRIAFLRDLSDQIDRETRLARALAAARAGEEAKARFVAVMSHEMRTPLSGLLSALDLLRATPLDPAQADLVGIMEACGHTTLEQVNNVLELTQLTAQDKGHAALDFDLRGLLQPLVRQFQARAQQHDTALTLETGPNGRVQLHAPLQLVKRVVGNLLSNAVKFTQGGRIVVSCLCTPAETPGKMLCQISVSDTGIGISAADFQRIFHAFETLDSTFSRTQDGSGLGLGIAKMAAEALGGRITVDSTPGKGSRFALSFEAALAPPAAPPAALAPPEPVAPKLAGLRLLLAEDNEINRLLLVRQLERLGHQVVAVADGAAAVEEIQLDQPFDVVLMDVSMPKMDGMTATRLLRGEDACLPIIALTAHADENRRAEFRAAGMDDVITKPVDMAHLQEVMAAFAHRTPPGLPSDQPRPAPLLIDDQVFDDLIQSLGADFLRQTLTRFAAEVDTALAAIAAAQSAGEAEQLALLAHREAGSAAMLGFAALAAALRKLETAARTDPIASLGAQIESLGPLHAAGLSEITRRLSLWSAEGRPL